MRNSYPIIFPLLIFVLAACQLVDLANSLRGNTDNVTATKEPGWAPYDEVKDSHDGVKLDLTDNQPKDIRSDSPPEIAWDRDPNALIISGTFCCGFSSPLVPINYIPDAQIWGDGRIIWVTYGEGGARRVLQDQLSLEQLETLLQKFVNDGFFGWQDRYANIIVSDLADKCVTVNLETVSKSVCEYYEGAPQAFHNLYDYLASGVGLEGKDYVPKTGYVVAYPLDDNAETFPGQITLNWSTNTLGLSLTEAVEEGVWVDGETLAIAWQTVNAKPWGMIVQEGDAYYEISFQIPGINRLAPPAE